MKVFVLSPELFQSLIKYLGTCPHDDVDGLLQTLRREMRMVEMEEKPAPDLPATVPTANGADVAPTTPAPVKGLKRAHDTPHP